VVTGIILDRNANGIESTQVRCFTDKSVYMQGECVIINMSNAASTAVSVIDREYIDGGFASIEIEQHGGTWSAIELLAVADIIVSKTLKPGDSPCLYLENNKL
jgi:hypothetical protein